MHNELWGVSNVFRVDGFAEAYAHFALDGLIFKNKFNELLLKTQQFQTRRRNIQLQSSILRNFLVSAPQWMPQGYLRISFENNYFPEYLTTYNFIFHFVNERNSTAFVYKFLDQIDELCLFFF